MLRYLQLISRTIENVEIPKLLQESLLSTSMARRKSRNRQFCDSTNSSSTKKLKHPKKPKTILEKSKKKVSATMTEDSLRRWTTIASDNDPKKTKGIAFTLMSYNVLAQDLINKHPHLYSKHNQNSLKWDHRFVRIIDEIRRIQPNILCLQEVQEDHLKMYLEEFRKIGLNEFLFKKRTKPELTDGCAIFYNSDLFHLVEQKYVEYYSPLCEILNRPNVAIIGRFQAKSNPDTNLVIATTHLLYSPKRQDVRLAQVQILLTEIDKMALLGRKANGQLNYAPIILTGDFNLKPNHAPYKLLTDGHLQYEHLSTRLLKKDRSCMSMGKEFLPFSLSITDNCQHFDEELQSNSSQIKRRIKVPFQTGTLRHKLNLFSAYNTELPIVSTHQDRWILVDYIFYRKEYISRSNSYEEDKLKLLAIYQLPTKDMAEREHDLIIPNGRLGSDHLSLAGKFFLFTSNVKNS